MSYVLADDGSVTDDSGNYYPDLATYNATHADDPASGVSQSGVTGPSTSATPQAANPGSLTTSIFSKVQGLVTDANSFANDVSQISPTISSKMAQLGATLGLGGNAVKTPAPTGNTNVQAATSSAALGKYAVPAIIAAVGAALLLL